MFGIFMNVFKNGCQEKPLISIVRTSISYYNIDTNKNINLQKDGPAVISFILDDTKQTMTKLLKETTFNDFLCISFELTQLFKISVDGQIRPDFLDSDDATDLSQRKHICWKDFQPHAFDLIRGQKAPTSMKITFALSPISVSSILTHIQFQDAQAIGGFNFTLHYEQSKIRIITGTNYANFTLDKAAEHYFDESMLRFFKKHGLPTLLALN